MKVASENLNSGSLGLYPEPNGKSIPVETRTCVGVAKSTKKRDAGVVGGAAGVGPAIGGAGGAGIVLATRGDEVH